MSLKSCPNCESTKLSVCDIYVQCDECLMIGPQMNKGVNDDHADHIDRRMAEEAWNNLPRRQKISNELFD